MKIKILPVFLWGSALINAGSAFSQSDKLNILLFTADDLDRNTLGCYGSLVPDISPNIDKFASEGLQFMHAYVNNSICQPSRGILSTGLYGHNSGVMGFMKMEEGTGIPIIGEIMREHGYRVGVLSKVEHSTPKIDFKWDYVYYQKDLGLGRSPSLYYKRTKEFFESCKALDKPFYFMVNSDDPHRPYFNPEEGLSRGMEYPSRTYRPNEIQVPGFVPDLPDVRRELSYYYNSVKRLDDTFGRVMQALEESGMKDNTLVIFMSDNGIALPFAKCDNYYASNRTPWLVRWPGKIDPGTVDDEHFIAEVDYFPTILEALNIKPPDNLDGVSRLPLYLGEDQAIDNVIFTQIDSKASGAFYPLRMDSTPMRGVQTGEYLFIFNAWVDGGNRAYANNNEGETMDAMMVAARRDEEIAKRIIFFRYRAPEEFYDLKKDPDCLINLISDEKYSAEIKEMRKSLVQHMEETNDPLLSVYKVRNSKKKKDALLYQMYPEILTVDKMLSHTRN
jgi:N-sulfoglucosamine sulfohydrolase